MNPNSRSRRADNGVATDAAMAAQTMKTPMPCPACGAELTYITRFIDIPYFKEALQSTIICDSCDYRHTNVVITSQDEPIHYEYPISSEEDMMVRVIRSNSGTIKVPELGVKIEPGQFSDAYITNIEGILERIRAIVENAMRSAEQHGQRAKAKAILKKIDEIESGKECATLIIDDPFGNSMILGEKARKRRLRAAELKTLKTGVCIIDASDVEQRKVVSKKHTRD